MRLYKMTATFGKLEHETLALEPGLNVIEAPNEWGKTTWCTFLVTMLYGLDTRAKTTKTALADKEKYAPWSGVPMAGRIDLSWNGRDITIERSTKGRTPMGVFRAYETVSGLAVPELTAANCGSVLLGVEQSVFRRTSFIRQSDLPVTQDDALRRRLNALVTTGDETGDSDRLAAELKDLKNKCRYNRSGLLPQAELQQKELEDKILELETLEDQCRKLKERITEVKSWGRALENHRDALNVAAAEANARRVAQIRELRDQAEEKMIRLEGKCSKQPSRDEVEKKIRAMEAYLEAQAEFREDEISCSHRPEAPVPPEQFRGMTAEQAGDMVGRDCRNYQQLSGKKPYLLLILLGWAAVLLGAVMIVMKEYVIAIAAGVLGLIALMISTRKKEDRRKEMEALEEKYGSSYPEAWQMLFKTYEAEKRAYEQALQEYQASRGDLDIRRTFLQRQREGLFGSQFPDTVMELWQQMRKNWEQYDSASLEFQQAEKYLSALQDMARAVPTPPAMEDILSYPPEETDKLLLEAREDLQRLQHRLGQYQGRMEALGDGLALKTQLSSVRQRIEKLEETYQALGLALDTLAQARQELQRKFAPRIASRAQQLLYRMTAGRYDRLTLNEDFSLMTAAAQEETMHEVLWRSDGTMDQLYLALRLAVAEELIPDAPLVLDDAFVRFDDIRLKAALEILKTESEQKQVILFTCQSREKAILY